MISFKTFFENSLMVTTDDLSNLTFEQFLSNITKDPKTGKPYTLEQFGDKTSYMSLYIGNKYGIGSSGQSNDEQIASLIRLISTYLHQRILWPKIQPMRDKLEQFYTTPEYKNYNKKRNDLFRAIVTARREGKDTSEFQKQKNDFENTAPVNNYIANVNKNIDRITKETYETLITSEFFEPTDPVNGETFTKAYNLFENLK
jgi:hypothetical protein